MKNLRQNGFAVMTLVDVVDDFCLAQGNMRESGILAVYRHARWAWKDIFRTALWEIRKAVLKVDCKDHSIHLPKDCERLINLSVVDCHGKIYPLGFNSDWNTAKINCLKAPCSCQKCHGENTLCGVVDSIKVVTETVVINSQNYTKTTMTRYDGSGAMQTQTTIPVWNQATSTVVYDTIIETICNVEVTDKGCIKPTQANMDILQSRCGATFLGDWGKMGLFWGNFNAYRELIPAPYNYFGEWNYNAADREIIHIFQHDRRHFNHNEEQEHEWRNNICQVILEYQTNGESPDTEILVPEFAVEAMQDGIFYRQKKLNLRVSAADRMAAKQAYDAAKIAIVKYLNPVIMENVAKLQTNPRPW